MTKPLDPIDFGEKYIVHPDGCVWRKPYTIYRNNQYTTKPFPVLKKEGWVSTRIRKAGKGQGGGYESIDLDKTWLVHRLVASLFIPNPDNLPDVNHIDGNRSNNHVSNLEWSSRSDNQKHAYKEIGRQRKSKVTDIQKREIYDLRNKEGLPLKAIADLYNINFRTVSAIAKGHRFIFREKDNANATEELQT